MDIFETAAFRLRDIYQYSVSAVLALLLSQQCTSDESVRLAQSLWKSQHPPKNTRPRVSLKRSLETRQFRPTHASWIFPRNFPIGNRNRPPGQCFSFQVGKVENLKTEDSSNNHETGPKSPPNCGQSPGGGAHSIDSLLNTLARDLAQCFLTVCHRLPTIPSANMASSRQC